MDSTYDALFPPHALFSLFLNYMGKIALLYNLQ